jgi:hypothetical protein
MTGAAWLQAVESRHLSTLKRGGYDEKNNVVYFCPSAGSADLRTPGGCRRDESQSQSHGGS